MFGENDVSNVTFSPLVIYKHTSHTLTYQNTHTPALPLNTLYHHYYIIITSCVCVCLYLVLHTDLCSECVVRAPFLSEGHSVLVPLVLGLQICVHFSRVSVGRAARLKLLNTQITLR